MTLEEEIANRMSIEMAREIDREILWSMLNEIGWTRVLLDRQTDNDYAIDIIQWLALNCKQSFERSGRDFIFESKVDAVNFTLRWL